MKGTVTVIKLTIYCINKRTRTKAQCFGLRNANAEENTVLFGAPNNWKTEAGARRWAEKRGFTVV